MQIVTYALLLQVRPESLLVGKQIDMLVCTEHPDCEHGIVLCRCISGHLSAPTRKRCAFTADHLSGIATVASGTSIPLSSMSSRSFVRSSVPLRPWIWEDQKNRKEDWPTIVNTLGTTIWIPPRRCVVQVELDRRVIMSRSRMTILLGIVQDEITYTHHYRRAPEPLKQLLSHFQIMRTDGGRTLHLQLTNISSQIIRKELYTRVLLALAVDGYGPSLTWIQQENQDRPTWTFVTKTIEDVMKVITTAQAKLDAHRAQEAVPVPWTTRAEIWVTHECTNRDQAVLPRRRREQQQQCLPSRDDEPGPSTSRGAKRMRKEHEMPETGNDSGHTSHSSYTSPTSRKYGQQESQAGQKSDQDSYRSTTPITSTSSSAHTQNAEETPQEPETVSVNSLVVRAQALRRRLLRSSKLRISGNSYYIASVTVSRGRVICAHREPKDVLADARCEQYHDDRKNVNTKRMGNVKRKLMVDIIIAKIEETGVNSAQEWENVVPPEFKLQLIKEFGPTVDSYIQKIIKIFKTEKVKKIKSLTLTELYMEHLESNVYEPTADFRAIVSWIQYLFLVNDIDLVEFMAWNEIVKTQRYIKVNGIVLEGYTNTGKSLLVDNLIGICRPEEITAREGQQRVSTRSATRCLLRLVRGAADHAHELRHVEVAARGKGVQDGY